MGKAFQLTRLMRGVTFLTAFTVSSVTTFQLTRLMRGVTSFWVQLRIVCVFQLTRLIRGVTVGGLCRRVRKVISTHTPHARRDKQHNS